MPLQEQRTDRTYTACRQGKGKQGGGSWEAWSWQPGRGAQSAGVGACAQSQESPAKGLTLLDQGGVSHLGLWVSKHVLGRKGFVGSKTNLHRVGRQEIAEGVQETKVCSVGY